VTPEHEAAERWLAEIGEPKGERHSTRAVLALIRLAFVAGFRRGWCSRGGQVYPDGFESLRRRRNWETAARRLLADESD
jgi:hypothetical protein